MAIAFVANALGGTTTTTSFSITLPATEAGDIIILEFAHRGTGDGTIGGTYTGPAFELKHSQLFASSLYSGKTYWSRATGDHSGETVTGSGLTNSCAAIITIYRGALVSGDPLADATIVGEQNASGDETQAEISNATAGAEICLVVVNSPDRNVSSGACTNPGALNERAERLSTGGTDTSVSHWSAAKADAGGTGAFTWSQTNAASGSWAYAIQPAPNAYTLPAAVGTFALAGQVAALLAARVLSAATGSFVLSGQDASLWRNPVLLGEAGSFVLTGQDAALYPSPRFEIQRKVGAGSYSTLVDDLPDTDRDYADTGPFDDAETYTYRIRLITQGAPGDWSNEVPVYYEEGVAYTLTAEAGAFALTGQAATLLATRILSGEAGAFALSGQDTALLVGHRLPGETGVFVLSGQNAALLRGLTLPAEVGAFTLDGQAASLLRGLQLEAEAGSFGLSGQAASFLRDYRLPGGVGAFVFTGQNATLTYSAVTGFTLVAEAGMFVLSGQDASLLRGLRLPAAAGSFVLGGQDAGFLRGYVLPGEAGSFGLSGQDAGLLRGLRLDAETGLYVLGGQDAGLYRGYTLDGEPGIFLLSGQDAAFLRDYILEVEPGVFVLTGRAADLLYSGIVGERVVLRGRLQRTVELSGALGLEVRLRGALGNRVELSGQLKE